MAKSNSQSDERVLPLFWLIGVITAIVGCFWFMLFQLSQPAIYANPGAAAYTPPPGTRLIPLLRKSDAPEVAYFPDAPASPLTAFAQAQTDQRGAMSEPPARKRTRATTPENDQRTSDYGQQWDYGYGAASGNRASSGPRRMSGGPKSSF